MGSLQTSLISGPELLPLSTRSVSGQTPIPSQLAYWLSVSALPITRTVGYQLRALRFECGRDVQGVD